MILRIVCCALSMLALAACTETRFESTPGDKIVACDPAWKGLWVDASANASKSEPDELAFRVDQECRFFMLERPEKDGPPKQIHIPLNYVHDQGKNYLVIADNQLGEVVDLAPVHGIKPVPKKSFFIARYEVDHDRLRIYPVDAKRSASLVIDEVLDGTVDASNKQLHVYIQGDRAKVLDIVRNKKIFAEKPDAEVRRIKLSLEQYERKRSARRAGKSP
ncbi:MAG TPA: hypothetical protein VFN25_11655 [Dokdonella sp.]|uniref:hypothetical protein n=1 Tax=Dokdonella sp. TaxID=2291710 RepID=UPI002D7E6E12|nr:hypothetical protein [Dokdonella sp.]HET9033550.1 hypothetical protein [Dokdonella sp.]